MAGWTTLADTDREAIDMRIQDDNERQTLLDAVAFNQEGLIAAIAQDVESQAVLMMAWMNREALDETLKTGSSRVLLTLTRVPVA